MTEKNEWKYSELKSEDRDLVWLPKSLCNKIKELDNGAAIEKEIMKYFDSAMFDSVYQKNSAIVKMAKSPTPHG